MRQKSLEELVFVTLDPDEKADYGTGPWLKYNAPTQPIVAYVDLNWGLPDLEHVWEPLRQTQGFLLAFSTGSAATMGTWLQREIKLLESKPEGMSHSRFFLRGAAEDGGVEAFVGWAIILRFPEQGVMPKVTQRMLFSVAQRNRCIEKLDAPAAACKQKPRTGHDICPQQRSIAFHEGILQGFSIMSPLMASGDIPMDFYLMEPESGTATLAHTIASAAEARSRNKSGASDHLRASIRFRNNNKTL